MSCNIARIESQVCHFSQGTRKLADWTRRLCFPKIFSFFKRKTLENRGASSAVEKWLPNWPNWSIPSWFSHQTYKYTLLEDSPFQPSNSIIILADNFVFFVFRVRTIILFDTYLYYLVCDRQYSYHSTSQPFVMYNLQTARLVRNRAAVFVLSTSLPTFIRKWQTKYKRVYVSCSKNNGERRT